jgi:peroxiredoxin
MRKKFLASLVLAGLAATFTGSAFAESKSTVAIGQPAPSFSLQDQTGKTVSLSDYAGKVVVLEWFNDGCPFVVKHYKEGHMNKLADELKAKDVVWLAINSTNSASVEHNAKVAADWNINRPVLDDKSGAVGHQYGATNTPHLYVIDKEGKLAYRGAIDSDSSNKTEKIDGSTNYVKAAVEELAAGSAVSRPETKAYGCTVKYAK